MDLGNQRQGQCLSSSQESRTEFLAALPCRDEGPADPTQGTPLKETEHSGPPASLLPRLA